MLDRCRVEFFADLHEQGVAGFPVRLACAHLDQFVRIKAGFQFANYGRGQAFVADDNYGIERMCAGAKGAALGGCKTEQMDLRGGL